ncbi:GNAT family N-acetyltransferase [Ramlibacter sp. G-1-2-2]|uniref:GNAT family N-acetyltransferase n=1 Tax=Ramlibacter agri TaxID=2728837 RepID=A0A848H803_9BURK|nr:GNAT family N-acetyltransferase [Ramlibacter agri]NML46644.1 GNAT family N-acetyltransferase [Ramlibacter agri]
METVTVSAATEEEVRSGDIGRRLRQFNYGVIGEYPETQYVRLNARDAMGRVVGGIRGFVFMYWLQIEVLFVDESMRGTGIGSALLLEAERQARELGAKNASLTTFEWQAPGFYARHGYEEEGRTEKYVGDFYLARMTKRL